MGEYVSFTNQEPENPTPEKTYLEGLKGISAQLEEVYQSLVMGDTLKKPEFADAAELVEDFRDNVKHIDGSSLKVSEAVRDLRIIAKEQHWNGDTWDWDVIRTEAAKMQYRVRSRKTDEEFKKTE